MQVARCHHLLAYCWHARGGVPLLLLLLLVMLLVVLLVAVVAGQCP